MRTTHRRFATLSLMSLLGLAWAGCEAKQQTEYVAGISTQVKVPRDLKSVRLSVSVGGVRQFCRGYRVYDGRVQLPRSLGTYALNDPRQSGPITYSIVGYTTDLEEGSEFDDLRCNDQVGGAEGARILRRSRQPYVLDEILFLPMPLKYSCFDTKCEGDGVTCKGGLCIDATTEPGNLREFDPSLVDGTGGACFPSSQCMAASLPAIPVDPDTCTFAVANTKDAPPARVPEANPFAAPGIPTGDGVNVEIAYDGGYVREILDRDPDEGFTIPDPQKPQHFRLAKGLCAMLHGYDETGKELQGHRITSVRASATCRPKDLSQPICQADAFAAMGVDENGVTSDPTPPNGCSPKELRPPKSLLVMVVDNTEAHAKFFADAPGEGVGLTLADPAFGRTDLALVEAPGTAADACSTSAAPAVAPKLARQAKDEILASIAKGPSAGATAVAMDGALARAYSVAKGGDYFKRAVLVVGNHDIDKDACPGDGKPSELASAAKAGTPRVDTHVILLAEPPAGTDPVSVAVEGAAVGVTAFTDGRGANKGNAAHAFQAVVESLTSCVYDAPSSPLKPDDVLTYVDPISGVTKRITHTAACTSETSTESGWGTGADGRVYVCGAACTDYRAQLKNGTFLNALFSQPAPAAPLFAHAAACAPKP